MSSYSSEPHIIATPNEFKILDPPSDGISDLAFTPDQGGNQKQILLVSSWDGTVRVYDACNASQNGQKTSYNHSGAVLNCAWLDSQRVASGGLDLAVKVYDVGSQQEYIMGGHDKAVRCVETQRDMGVLVTGSWDSTLKVWDPRTRACANTLNQPERVYSMSLCGSKVIVGCAQRKVWIWDLRNMAGPEQKRDSSLKFQTRAIKAFPNNQGYVLSSIEGRVAVEYLDMDSEIQRKKYAFKCHRVKEGGIEKVFPVNALAFHPLYHTFATGGSDALVNIWDPFNKKRLCQFHKYPTSIGALAFNSDGSLLAMGCSYQYELPQDPNPIPKDAIFIRKVTDQETKPKS